MPYAICHTYILIPPITIPSLYLYLRIKPISPTPIKLIIPIKPIYQHNNRCDRYHEGENRSALSEAFRTLEPRIQTLGIYSYTTLYILHYTHILHYIYYTYFVCTLEPRIQTLGRCCHMYLCVPIYLYVPILSLSLCTYVPILSICHMPYAICQMTCTTTY
jgi:hypothetical protein